MTKIKLLAFNRGYPIESAIVKRIHHLFEELLNNDIQIKVISIRDNEKIKKEEGVHKGIKYVRIGSGLSYKIGHLHLNFIGLLRVLFIIFSFKEKKAKNVLYTGGMNIENFIFILFAKLMGYKIIFDIVEDFTSFTDEVKLISKFKFWTTVKFTRLNVLVSNSIIVISTFLFQKYKNINATNITLIPITAKIQSNLKKKTSFNKIFTIIYVGTFAGKDGVDFIIDGFIKFNKIITDSKLYLIGSGIRQQKYKKKYVANRNIEFTGFIPDEEYYPFIQKADVLCMCRNNSEFANAGFPFKLGEYLATGNPVIATRVSDVEVYLSPESAYLIEPEKEQQFIDTLFSIRNNPTEAFCVGLNGLNICAKYFDIKKNSQLFLDVVTRL